MSLRHAVLGVLSSMPMSGYDMQHYFEEAGYFWPASHAQVYQELRKMEHEDLIAATITPRGSRAEKRTYHVTEAGEQELRRFATQPYPYPAERDGMRLQFMYLDLVPLDIARQHLNAHIAHYRLQLAHLRDRIDGIANRRSSLMRSRLNNRPPEVHEAIIAFRVHAMEAHVAQAEAEISWAERGLELVARLDASRSANGEEPSNVRPLKRAQKTARST